MPDTKFTTVLGVAVAEEVGMLSALSFVCYVKLLVGALDQETAEGALQYGLHDIAKVIGISHHDVQQ